MGHGPGRHLIGVVVAHEVAVEREVEAQVLHGHLVVGALVLAPQLLVAHLHRRAHRVAHTLSQELPLGRRPQVADGASEEASRGALEDVVVKRVADAAAHGRRQRQQARADADGVLCADADGHVEAAVAKLVGHLLLGDAHAQALGLVGQQLALDEAIQRALTRGAHHGGVVREEGRDEALQGAERRHEVSVVEGAAPHAGGVGDLKAARLAALRPRTKTDAEDRRHRGDEDNQHQGLGVLAESFQHGSTLGSARCAWVWEPQQGAPTPRARPPRASPATPRRAPGTHPRHRVGAHYHIGR